MSDSARATQPDRGHRTIAVKLAVGDVMALVVFTVIGLLNHERGVTPGGLLKILVPIIAVGALAARLVGTYRRPAITTLLAAWAIAVPSGILIRKAVFGEPATTSGLVVFMGVALAFTLLFLLVWRALARALGIGRAATSDR